jgi:hypothetical protein
MEQNYAGAKDRETSFRSRQKRRENWLKRAWRLSLKGSSYIKADGFHVAVYPRGTYWGGIITHRASGWEMASRKVRPTERDAKLAAFDTIEILRDRRPWEQAQ